MLSLIANGLCDSFSITILTPYEAESFYPFDERITIENLGFKNRKLSVLRKLQYFPILRKLQCFLHQTDICPGVIGIAPGFLRLFPGFFIIKKGETRCAQPHNTNYVITRLVSHETIVSLK